MAVAYLEDVQLSVPRNLVNCSALDHGFGFDFTKSYILVASKT